MLEQATPSGSYRLVAGGRGFLTPNDVRWSAADPRAIELPVLALQGCLVRFVDELGQELLFPPGFWRGIWSRKLWHELGPDASFLSSASPFLALSGLDPALVVGRPLSWELTLVGSQRPDPPPGLCHESGHPPGHSSYELEYELGPIVGSIGEVTIALRRTASGWGNLALRFVDEEGGAEPQEQFLPLPGMLHLVPRTHGAIESRPSSRPQGFEVVDPVRGSGITFVLERGQTSPWIFEGIPAGPWSLHFVGLTGGYRFPERDAAPLELEVASGALAEVRIPLPSTGALELRLRREGGGFHEGQIHLSLVPVQLREGHGDGAHGRSRAGASSTTMVLMAPPYRVGGLAPGRWEVRVLFPRLAPQEGGSRLDALVEPGEVALLDALIAR